MPQDEVAARWSRTRGLLGARELSLMKPTAYLINRRDSDPTINASGSSQ